MFDFGRFDKNMPGAASLEAFEAQYMEPHVLLDQLKRAFLMKVTPQELGAIMHHFDPVRLIISLLTPAFCTSDVL